MVDQLPNQCEPMLRRLREQFEKRPLRRRSRNEFTIRPGEGCVLAPSTATPAAILVPGWWNQRRYCERSKLRRRSFGEAATILQNSLYGAVIAPPSQ